MEVQGTLWDTGAPSRWMDFREARVYARSLGLSSQQEWVAFIRRSGNTLPVNIPFHPDETYRLLGWQGWDDWLGAGGKTGGTNDNPVLLKQTGPDLWQSAPANPYLPFHEARAMARSYGFEYREEWEAWVNGRFPRRPPLTAYIPANPDFIYRYTGWKNWSDWLIDPGQKKEYTDFTVARQFVRSLRLRNKEDWRHYIRSGDPLHHKYSIHLPDNPQLEYGGRGWEDWDDWLGNRIRYLSFEAARRYVHSLRLENETQWRKFCAEIPEGNPAAEGIFTYPELAYSEEGWQGWDHWLGTGPHAPEPFHSSPAGLYPGARECWCKGQLIGCKQCGGRGFY